MKLIFMWTLLIVILNQHLQRPITTNSQLYCIPGHIADYVGLCGLRQG